MRRRRQARIRIWTEVGTFTDALMAQAKKKDWAVISMKNDWKKIFAFEK
jgi:hypothetical protein